MDSSNIFSGNIFVMFISSIPIPAGPVPEPTCRLLYSGIDCRFFSTNGRDPGPREAWLEERVDITCSSFTALTLPMAAEQTD